MASKQVYRSFKRPTTWTGLQWAAIVVNPTMSLKYIVTSANSSGSTLRPTFSFSATVLGSIRFRSCSVFLRSMSSWSVRSRISSSKLFEYFSSIWNIVSTKFTFRPWLSCLNLSYTLTKPRRRGISFKLIRVFVFNFWDNDNYVLKSGRISGISAQHCRIILIASGGAAPLDTLGRISGGGFFILAMISVERQGKNVSSCFHFQRLDKKYTICTGNTDS